MIGSWGEGRAILSRTPNALTALLAGLDDGWTRADEGPETFTTHDVVGHLADLEATDWVARIRIVVEEPGRPFDPVDRFSFREWASDLPLEALLEEFARRRKANLEAVDGMDLTAEDLTKPGTHPALGDVVLGQLIAAWVVHDLTHVAQITRVMAKRYRTAVGPWADYLSILTGSGELIAAPSPWVTSPGAACRCSRCRGSSSTIRRPGAGTGGDP